MGGTFKKLASWEEEGAASKSYHLWYGGGGGCFKKLHISGVILEYCTIQPCSVVSHVYCVVAGCVRSLCHVSVGIIHMLQGV